MNLRQALDRLEDLLLTSPSIPLLRYYIIAEDAIVDQLDEIRVNLPEEIAEAESIVTHREEIIGQAHRYAQEIVAAAQLRAEQILNESRIIQTAEQQAIQIRYHAQQERNQILQQAMQEAEHIRQEMDTYADHVLHDLEHQLGQTLHIIHTSRQQLAAQSQDMRS